MRISARLASLVILLAACGPSRVAMRRTLMTDQIARAASPAAVEQRLASTGWCRARWSAERFQIYFKCDGTAAMAVTFEFIGDKMASATLHVLTPTRSTRTPRAWPLPARLARPGGLETSDAMGMPAPVLAFTGWTRGYGPNGQVPMATWDLFEALSFELEQRYGKARLVAGDPYWRFWMASPLELVELRVTWNGWMVEEVHYFLGDVTLFT